MKQTVLCVVFLLSFFHPISPKPPQAITPEYKQPLMAAIPPSIPVQAAPAITSEKVEPEVVPSPTVVVSPRVGQRNPNIPIGSIESYLMTATANRFGSSQVSAMRTLMSEESGLNPYVINPTSGACGIPQALPCSKLLTVIGSLDNVSGQIEWLLGYVANRYGTPSNALAFHRVNNWY